MKIRIGIAGVVAATVLASGAGLAYADSSGPSTPSTPSTATTRCAGAQARIDRLEHRRAQIERRVDRLQAAKAKALAHGRTELADRIQSRIDRLRVVADKISRRIERIEQRCGVTPSASSASSTTSTTVPAG